MNAIRILLYTGYSRNQIHQRASRTLEEMSLRDYDMIGLLSSLQANRIMNESEVHHWLKVTVDRHPDSNTNRVYYIMSLRDKGQHDLAVEQIRLGCKLSPAFIYAGGPADAYESKVIIFASFMVTMGHKEEVAEIVRSAEAQTWGNA